MNFKNLAMLLFGVHMPAIRINRGETKTCTIMSIFITLMT